MQVELVVAKEASVGTHRDRGPQGEAGEGEPLGGCGEGVPRAWSVMVSEWSVMVRDGQ